MVEYTLTSYVYQGWGVHQSPVEMTVSDDDDTFDWGDDSGDNETATIDGTTHNMTHTGIYKISFENSEGEDATEDMVYSHVAGVGWMMTPTQSDTQFDEGSQITEFHGWQQTGNIDYSDYVAVCFATGTLIETVHGPRLVEDITAGEMVLTLDDGPQPVIWSAASRVDMAGQIIDPKRRAVRICVGALGPGQPYQDVLVSPQHRVLVSDWRALHSFGREQVLVPAIGLLGLPGVQLASPIASLSWHHILLPRHNIVTTSGLESESFFPGKIGIRNLAPAARQSLFTARPDLHEDLCHYGPAVRHCLTRQETRVLAWISMPVPNRADRQCQSALVH